MATITTIPEPSPSIIAQAAIQLTGTGDTKNYYAYDPMFKGRCYFLCFHCHAPLYRESSSTNTHDERCAKFPGKHDKEAILSNDWKIIYVFGDSATDRKDLQIIKESYLKNIAPLVEVK